MVISNNLGINCIKYGSHIVGGAYSAWIGFGPNPLVAKQFSHPAEAVLFSIASKFLHDSVPVMISKVNLSGITNKIDDIPTEE